MAFEHIQQATREHRRSHGCHAYAYADGAALTALVAQTRAQRVLELGTALGYTACCLAAAGPLVHVDTIEADPTHVALARQNIAQAGLADRIVVRQGDFHGVLLGLWDGYDFAFFDGVAPEPALIRMVSDLLAPGGTLACGNLHLASGALMRELADPTRWLDQGRIEGGDTGVFVKARPAPKRT